MCEDIIGLHRQPKVPRDRVINSMPSPFLADSDEEEESFSPLTVAQSDRHCSAAHAHLAFKLAKMIVLGDCGVGKTAMVQR